MASLLLSSWGLHPHHNGIVANCQCAGIFAVVEMVSSPSLLWCHCLHCTSVAALVTLALSSLLCWPICPHIAWVSSPSLPRRCCLRWAGVFAPLRWCHCPCHAGVIALSAWALAPLLHRPLCSCCVCIVQSICRRLHPRWAGMYYAADNMVDHTTDNSNTNATRAATPAWHEQQCQQNEGNGASKKRVTIPAQSKMPAWGELMPARRGRQFGQVGECHSGVWV